MSMFDGYEKLSNKYPPSNLKTCPPPIKDCCDKKIKPADPNKPYTDYNIEGEIIGYFWYYGDTVKLDFDVVGELTVEGNALIYNAINQAPNINTRGQIGQRAYNVVDYISWTLVSIVTVGERFQYNWVKDEEFHYPDVGTDVYVEAAEFLKDKYARVTIYNFRNEPILEQTYNASTGIEYIIDTETSKKLVRGIYYCSLAIYDDYDYYSMLISPTQCKFTVR